jgi:tRNA(Glu) U13 pseudouridine synthase TruD
LRRISGPTQERDGTWRIKTNDELNKLIGNKTMINYIKSQRLGWFGHVHRMSDERMVKKVYEWKPMAIRSLGRPQTRWENEVKNDLNIMKIYTIGKTASRTGINGKKSLRRPKYSMNEVAEREEEEGTVIQWR